MIKLPTDWLELIQVSPTNRALYLAFINDAGQYWVYYQPLDAALPLPKLLEDLAAKLNDEYMGLQKAHYLYRDLHDELVEPSDQNWRPMPMLANDTVSMAQYRAMNGMAGGIEAPAPPPPSNLPSEPGV